MTHDIFSVATPASPEHTTEPVCGQPQTSRWDVFISHSSSASGSPAGWTRRTSRAGRTVATCSGLITSIQDVQIDECLSKGDPSSIFLRFLTKGIRTPGGWARLLSKAPHFAIHCDKWDQFSTGDWLDLLRARPEFADKCDIWSRFSAGDWERLLLVRPELAHYREKGKN